MGNVVKFDTKGRHIVLLYISCSFKVYIYFVW